MARVLTQFEAARIQHSVPPAPWSEAVQRKAQRRWAETPLLLRVYAIGRLRRCLSQKARQFAAAVERPGREEADTVAAEVLPLLDACRFLEREAEEILRPRPEPADARPLWLRGVHVETRREPFGIVLLIAPSNYPLLLPGVQAVQALCAGNAVVWKPGAGGAAVAHIFAEAVAESGLDPHLVHVTDESSRTGAELLEENFDKVVLTGSAETGARVREAVAGRAVPTTMELSGCDSVFVLVDANMDRAVEALVFGSRFNASATCMAPRRIFVAEPVARSFEQKLAAALEAVGAVQVPAPVRSSVDALVRDACAMGAHMVLDGRTRKNFAPVLLADVRPEMAIAKADIFAPVLLLLPFRYEREAVEADRKCPYALSSTIFGAESAARKLAEEIDAGCVLINDVIAATVDPRVAFGGRHASGYGVTRGREGLLEMTAVKTVIVRRGDDRRAYRMTGNRHAEFFYGYIDAVHGEGLRTRWSGLLRTIKGAMALNRGQK